MKLKLTLLGATLLLAIATQAQRKPRNTSNDTIASNYYPASLFAPGFYTEKGNEFHSP
jgi:hypothetical protein